jgi:hypothetical protein
MKGSTIKSNAVIMESISDMIPVMESTCGIKFSDRSRKRPLVAARAAFIHVMNEKTGLSLVNIGELLNVDHSVCIHHRNNHDANLNDFVTDFGKIYRMCIPIFSRILESQNSAKSRVHAQAILGYNMGRLA